MIREICRDETFLAQKAAPATADDLATAQDLLDTLTAHRDGCVGMAANMIGVCKRIIAFDNEGTYMVMFNPSSSGSPGRTRPRRAASPSPASGKRNGSRPSRSNGRMKNSRPG